MVDLINHVTGVTIMVQNWINGILGLVVIAVAFMGLTGSTLVWTLAVAGVLIVLTSIWGGYVGQEEEQAHRHA